MENPHIMDAISGLILVVFIVIGMIASAAGLWYINTTSAWDHAPTDEELGQRIMEDFILPREDS